MRIRAPPPQSTVILNEYNMVQLNYRDWFSLDTGIRVRSTFQLANNITNMTHQHSNIFILNFVESFTRLLSGPMYCYERNRQMCARIRIDNCIHEFREAVDSITGTFQHLNSRESVYGSKHFASHSEPKSKGGSYLKNL